MQQPVAETEELGVSLSRVLATAIVVRENRGLNVAKLLALKESISLELWHITSLLTVLLLADGTYLLVDGLHRLTAVLQLIMANILPADYTVRCVVLSADTPANVLQECKRGQDSYAKLELMRERVAARRAWRQQEGYKF